MASTSLENCIVKDEFVVEDLASDFGNISFPFCVNDLPSKDFLFVSPPKKKLSATKSSKSSRKKSRKSLQLTSKRKHQGREKTICFDTELEISNIYDVSNSCENEKNRKIVYDSNQKKGIATNDCNARNLMLPLFTNIDPNTTIGPLNIPAKLISRHPSDYLFTDTSTNCISNLIENTKKQSARNRKNSRKKFKKTKNANSVKKEVCKMPNDTCIQIPVFDAVPNDVFSSQEASYIPKNQIKKQTDDFTFPYSAVSENYRQHLTRSLAKCMTRNNVSMDSEISKAHHLPTSKEVLILNSTSIEPNVSSPHAKSKTAFSRRFPNTRKNVANDNKCAIEAPNVSINSMASRTEIENLQNVGKKDNMTNESTLSSPSSIPLKKLSSSSKKRKRRAFSKRSRKHLARNTSKKTTVCNDKSEELGKMHQQLLSISTNEANNVECNLQSKISTQNANYISDIVEIDISDDNYVPEASFTEKVLVKEELADESAQEKLTGLLLSDVDKSVSESPFMTRLAKVISKFSLPLNNSDTLRIQKDVIRDSVKLENDDRIDGNHSENIQGKLLCNAGPTFKHLVKTELETSNIEIEYQSNINTLPSAQSCVNKAVSLDAEPDTCNILPQNQNISPTNIQVVSTKNVAASEEQDDELHPNIVWSLLDKEIQAENINKEENKTLDIDLNENFEIRPSSFAALVTSSHSTEAQPPKINNNGCKDNISASVFKLPEESVDQNFLTVCSQKESFNDEFKISNTIDHKTFENGDKPVKRVNASFCKQLNEGMEQNMFLHWCKGNNSTKMEVLPKFLEKDKHMCSEFFQLPSSLMHRSEEKHEHKHEQYIRPSVKLNIRDIRKQLEGAVKSLDHGKNAFESLSVEEVELYYRMCGVDPSANLLSKIKLSSVKSAKYFNDDVENFISSLLRKNEFSKQRKFMNENEFAEYCEAGNSRMNFEQISSKPISLEERQENVSMKDRLLSLKSKCSQPIFCKNQFSQNNSDDIARDDFSTNVINSVSSRNETLFNDKQLTDQSRQILSDQIDNIYSVFRKPGLSNNLIEHLKMLKDNALQSSSHSQYSTEQQSMNKTFCTTVTNSVLPNQKPTFLVNSLSSSNTLYGQNDATKLQTLANHLDTFQNALSKDVSLDENFFIGDEMTSTSSINQNLIEKDLSSQCVGSELYSPTHPTPNVDDFDNSIDSVVGSHNTITSGEDILTVKLSPVFESGEVNSVPEVMNSTTQNLTSSCIPTNTSSTNELLTNSADNVSINDLHNILQSVHSSRTSNSSSVLERKSTVSKDCEINPRPKLVVDYFHKSSTELLKRPSSDKTELQSDTNRYNKRDIDTTHNSDTAKINLGHNNFIDTDKCLHNSPIESSNLPLPQSCKIQIDYEHGAKFPYVRQSDDADFSSPDNSHRKMNLRSHKTFGNSLKTPSTQNKKVEIERFGQKSIKNAKNVETVSETICDDLNKRKYSEENDPVLQSPRYVSKYEKIMERKNLQANNLDAKKLGEKNNLRSKQTECSKFTKLSTSQKNISHKSQRRKRSKWLKGKHRIEQSAEKLENKEKGLKRVSGVSEIFKTKEFDIQKVNSPSSTLEPSVSNNIKKRKFSEPLSNDTDDKVKENTTKRLCGRTTYRGSFLADASSNNPNQNKIQLTKKEKNSKQVPTFQHRNFQIESDRNNKINSHGNALSARRASADHLIINAQGEKSSNKIKTNAEKEVVEGDTCLLQDDFFNYLKEKDPRLKTIQQQQFSCDNVNELSRTNFQTNNFHLNSTLSSNCSNASAFVNHRVINNTHTLHEKNNASQFGINESQHPISAENENSRLIHSQRSKAACICLPPKELKSSIGNKIFETLEVLFLILEWNVDWLVQQQKHIEPPPIAKQVLKIENSYIAFKDYYNTYLPLLLFETWHRIYTSWITLHKVQPYYGQVISYEKETHCVTITCEIISSSSDIDGKLMPEEGTIIMVRFATKYGKGITVLGYVTAGLTTAFDPNLNPHHPCLKTLSYLANDPLHKLIVKFLCAYTCDDFDLHQFIRINVLCNIKSTLKQNDALLSVNNSPMNIIVLSPSSDGLNPVEIEDSCDFQIDKSSKMEEVIRKILTGVKTLHPIPLLTVVKCSAQTNRLQILPHLLERIKTSYRIKILLCTRNTKTLDDIAFSLNSNSLRIAIIGKRGDTHQKLRKYLLEEQASYKLKSLETANGIEFPEENKFEYLMKAKRDILNRCDVILSKIHNCHATFIASTFNDFDCVAKMCCIIDEANLCTEPEILIPLIYGVSKLILIGDPRVYAKVLSRYASNFHYNRSLFHRAHEIDVFSDQTNM